MSKKSRKANRDPLPPLPDLSTIQILHTQPGAEELMFINGKWNDPEGVLAAFETGVINGMTIYHAPVHLAWDLAKPDSIASLQREGITFFDEIAERRDPPAGVWDTWYNASSVIRRPPVVVHSPGKRHLVALAVQGCYPSAEEYKPAAARVSVR